MILSSCESGSTIPTSKKILPFQQYLVLYYRYESHLSITLQQFILSENYHMLLLDQDHQPKLKDDLAEIPDNEPWTQPTYQTYFENQLEKFYQVATHLFSLPFDKDESIASDRITVMYEMFLEQIGMEIVNETELLDYWSELVSTTYQSNLSEFKNRINQKDLKY